MAKFSTGIPEFQPAAKGLGPVDLPASLRYHLDINPELSTGAAIARRHMEIHDKGAQALNARRQMTDPTITEGLNDVQITRATNDFYNEYVASQERAVTAMQESLTAAEYKLNAKVGVTATSDAREIRDRLAAMSNDDRSAAMRDAFANGDKAVIGAIVGFSKVMHGCDPAIVEPLFEKFKRTVAHAEYAVVDEHKKYLGYLKANDTSVYRFTVDALKGCKGYAKAKETYDAVLKSYEQPEAE